MSEVTIKVPENFQALMAKGPAAIVMPALAQEMDRQNELTIGATVKTRMSFPRSQKPTPEGTRVITGLLRRSLNRSASVITGERLDSAIGSNIRYFGKLEEGGTETVRGHHRAGRRRFVATDGSVFSESGARALGALTKAGKLRRGTAVREERKRVAVWGHQRTYKARRMLGRTLEARQADYGKGMTGALVRALQGGGS